MNTLDTKNPTHSANADARDLEGEIEALIAGEATAENIKRLGILCGELAVEVCGRDGETHNFDEWAPLDGDIEALEELAGGEPTEEQDELFGGGYREGVERAVSTIKG